jgi:hypothetical protein
VCLCTETFGHALFLMPVLQMTYHLPAFLCVPSCCWCGASEGRAPPPVQQLVHAIQCTSRHVF